MMDNKISTAQLATSDMLAFMYDEIDAIKKGKSVVDNTNSSDVLNPCSSAMPTRTSDQLYGTSPGYFVGQMPPPLLVQTGLDRPVKQPVRPIRSVRQLVRPVPWWLFPLRLHRLHQF